MGKIEAYIVAVYCAAMTLTTGMLIDKDERAPARTIKMRERPRVRAREREREQASDRELRPPL